MPAIRENPSAQRAIGAGFRAPDDTEIEKNTNLTEQGGRVRAVGDFTRRDDGKLAKEAKRQERQLEDLRAANQVRESLGLLSQGIDEKMPGAHVDTEKYNAEPLPFEAVYGGSRTIRWSDFDQDSTGEFVYLYRGLDNMDLNLVQGLANKSRSAADNETSEQIFARYGTRDIKKIAESATDSFQGSSPVLHTTRNRAIAEGVGSNGVVVTFKVPKKWLMQQHSTSADGRPIFGNEGEQELDFFYQLPETFVDKVEQFGADVDVINYTPPVASGGEDNDVFTLGDTPPNESARPYAELP